MQYPSFEVFHAARRAPAASSLGKPHRKSKLLTTVAVAGLLVGVAASGAAAQSFGGNGGGQNSQGPNGPAQGATDYGTGGTQGEPGNAADPATDAGGGGAGADAGDTGGTPGMANGGSGGYGGGGGTSGFGSPGGTSFPPPDNTPANFGAGGYTGGTGATGGDGSFTQQPGGTVDLGGGGGGSGGYGAVVSGTGAFEADANVTGGTGGFGGNAEYLLVPLTGYGTPDAGSYAGGNGGDGGVGVSVARGETFTVGGGATITGGLGGDGGQAYYGFSDSGYGYGYGYGYGSAASAFGGSGGSGGAGILMLQAAEFDAGVSTVIVGAGTTVLGGNGGNGYGASTYSGMNEFDGNGGNGGDGIRILGGGLVQNAGTIQGGNGGFGYGFGLDSGEVGGNGGTGGAGIRILSGGTVQNTGTITGGTGGTGGFGQAASGLAGAGGAGIYADNGATITNAGTITGGVGGFDEVGTGGGIGGVGVGGTGLNLTNAAAGIITGGLGGSTLPGNTPGAGAAGVSATSSTIFNQGTIVGGNGGGPLMEESFAFKAALVVATPDAPGGYGITGSDLTVINAGTVIGGVSSQGAQQADAIVFTGGTNSLTIYATSNIQGFSIAASAADTFALGGPTNASFDVGRLGAVGSGTDFQGFGHFAKVDASTWTLTGTNTGISGPLDVTDGTLVINATIPNIDLTVGDATIDPTVGGSGTFGNLTLGVNGVAAPGITTPYSTLHLSKNIVFDPGSTYQVQINAAGQTDLILAQGTATINGAAGGVAGPTVSVIAANGAYNVNQRYTILTAAAGRTGTFSGLTTTMNLAFLSPYLIYDPNDVILALRQNNVPFTFTAKTPNQQAAAGGIQSLPPNNQLFGIIVGQTVPGSQQAFNALSGEGHASAATAGIVDARIVDTAIIDRLWNIGGSSGDALQVLQGFGQGTLPTLLRCYAPNDTVTPAILSSYSVWAQGIGDFGHNGGNGNAASLDRALGGFIAGVDVPIYGRFADVWRVGIAGGYSNDNLTVSDRSTSGNFESVFGSLYAGVRAGPFDGRFGVSLATNNTTLHRTVAFPGLSESERSNYGGSTIQGFGEIGYRFAFGHNVLEPVAGFTAVSLHQDGFTEKGGLGALRGFGRDTDVQTSEIGFRGEALPFANLPLVARLHLAWQHTYGDINPAAVVAFEGGGSAFQVSGAPIDRDAALIEVGADYRASNALTVGLSYVGTIGSRDDDNSVRGKVDYRF